MDDLDEIVGEFLVESHENLDQLDRDLVELEGDPTSRELLSSIFRTVHTIKGTSGFLAFGTLETVTHVGEGLLSRLRDGEMTLTPGLTTILLEMVDAVRSLLANIEETGTEGSETYADLVARLEVVLAGADGAADAAADAVTAEIEELEELVLLPAAEEPVLPSPEDRATEPGRPSVAEGSVRVDVALLDSLMNLVGELVLTRNQMLQCASSREDAELHRTTHRLDLIAGELQDGVMKTRMQPIDQVWSKLPRVVRDLSVQLGKSVDLQMEGRDTELDRTILEAVRDPLTHLVRNSVDHGIEAPAVRVAAGKPEQRHPHAARLPRGRPGEHRDLRRRGGDRPGPPAGEGRRARHAHRRCRPPASRTARPSTWSSRPGSRRRPRSPTCPAAGSAWTSSARTSRRSAGASTWPASPARGTTVRIRIPLTLAIIPALVVTAARPALRDPAGQPARARPARAPASRTAGWSTSTAPRSTGCAGSCSRSSTCASCSGCRAATPARRTSSVLRADNRRYGLVVDDGPRHRGDRREATGAAAAGHRALRRRHDHGRRRRRPDPRRGGRGPARRPGGRGGAGPGGGARRRPASAPPCWSSGSATAGVPPSRWRRSTGSRRSPPVAWSGWGTARWSSTATRSSRWSGSTRPLRGPGVDGDGLLQVVVCRSGAGRVGVVVSSVHDIVEEDLVRSGLGSAGHDGSAVVAGRVTELVDLEHAVRTLAPSLSHSFGTP